MFDPIITGHKLNQVLNRAVFLAILLPSVSAFAATPVEPANGEVEPGSVNEQAAPQPQPDARRVFKRDFERKLVIVSKQRSTEMVWLRNNRADASQKSKIVWLEKPKKAD